MATGPYAGTFEETGTVTLGPPDSRSNQPILSLIAKFTINSPSGRVEGTKVFVPGSSTGGTVSCRQLFDGSFRASSFNQNLRVEATIETPDERTCKTAGAASLSFVKNSAVLADSFTENFVNVAPFDPPTCVEGISPPQISIADTTVNEGDSGTSDATFNVTLSKASPTQVTVDYATADGTATQPEDYEQTQDTLTFETNETTETVTVPVRGDTADEPNESFKVLLSNPQNAEIADGEGSATIVDDDEVAPTTTATRSLEPNAAGWNKEDVTVTLTATDNEGGSGVKEIAYSTNGGQPTTEQDDSVQVPVSAEGETTIDFYATDKEGNTEEEQTTTVKIDKTAPSITAVRSPDANANGWNNSDVTVSFTCSDELSGLDSSGCPDNVTLSSEGANQSVTRSVADAAGNIASDTVDNIKIDTSAPTISDLGPTTQPNANGWYNTDVTNRFEASDSGSGLDDACQTAFSDQAGHNVQSKTTSGEGMAVKVTSDSCTDVAGNTATGKDSATFKIDKTAPSVSETIPKANATKVSRTTPVTAKFSEAVQADTLTSDTVQLFSGNSTKPVKATLSKTSNSVTLTPSTRLDANNRFTVKIEGGATGVKDLADNPLSDFSWTFTTGGR